MAAALLVPFVLQSIFIVIAVALGPATPGYSNAGSLILNALVGFVFLVRAFRVYGVAAGIVYLPAMVATLVGYSLAFNGAVYGNWL